MWSLFSGPYLTNIQQLSIFGAFSGPDLTHILPSLHVSSFQATSTHLSKWSWFASCDSKGGQMPRWWKDCDKQVSCSTHLDRDATVSEQRLLRSTDPELVCLTLTRIRSAWNVCRTTHWPTKGEWQQGLRRGNTKMHTSCFENWIKRFPPKAPDIPITRA